MFLAKQYGSEIHSLNPKVFFHIFFKRKSVVIDKLLHTSVLTDQKSLVIICFIDLNTKSATYIDLRQCFYCPLINPLHFCKGRQTFFSFFFLCRCQSQFSLAQCQFGIAKRITIQGDCTVPILEGGEWLVCLL